MKNLSIVDGNLEINLDCPYDKEANKIDVYSSVHWTADDEKSYKAKEKFINDWKYEDDNIKAHAWFDISGYDYWVIQMEEENYISIDVVLKKQPEEYTQEEIQFIASKIEEWDEYFINNIT